MIQPFTGGINLRVFALLTFLVAALSSFGQNLTDTKIPDNSGFRFGTQETDAQMFNEDVTGATTINPRINRRDELGAVSVKGREIAHMGDSTSAEFSTGVILRPLIDLTGNSRLRGVAPKKSVLQAGPFFLQVHDVTGSLLVSDNVNFVPHNAEWGAIAILRTRISAILQIAPTWRLTVSGSVIYLPFKNEFGIEGFGIGDAIGLLAEGNVAPLTRLQLAYNSHWADWEVLMADEFRARYVGVNGGYDGDTSGFITPGGVHAEDTAGRYVYGNGTTIPDQNLERRQNDFFDVRTFIELENVVAGSASRLLPTETRVTFGASHSDFWYKGNWDDGTNNVDGLGFSARSVDRVYAVARNERESMRFKPYAYYDAYRYNYDPNWTHSAAAGFSGPVTEYLFLRAEVGYTWSSVLLKNTWFARASLWHDLGPYTRQFWKYSRDVTEPVREIRDRYLYGISQVLGPQLWGHLYAQRSVFEPEQFGVYGSVEDTVNVRVKWAPAPRHSYHIGASYGESRFDNPTHDRETRWEARAEIRYRWRPDVTFSLLYRYLNINTVQSLQGSDTAENLWIFTGRKSF